MMQNNRLWVLMARLLSGEASSGETEELQALLQENHSKQYLLSILHAYFTPPASSNTETSFADPDFEERFLHIMRQGDEHQPAGKNTRSLWGRIASYAAMIAAILVLGWGIYRLSQPAVKSAGSTPASGSEFVARLGARTKLVLPDNSQVWLNSGSRLNYQNDFNTYSREVELEGEAYFDVAKDSEHPFIVHTSK